MPKILSNIQKASLFPGLFVVTKQQSWQLFAQRILQKIQYSAKQPEHGLKVRSDYLNIQKSFKKQSQALKIHSTRPLLQIFQGRYCSFFNPNPTP
jgi:hypothetical protein